MFRITCFTLSLMCSLTLRAQDKMEYAVTLLDTALIKNAESVIRHEETRYIVNSPRTYTQTTYKVVTILKQNAAASVIAVSYNQYSKAEIAGIAIYDARGKLIRRVRPDEVEDIAAFAGNNFLVDERMLYFRSFAGQLPYTLEYKWQVNYRETQYYPAWIPIGKNESVEEATFILESSPELIFKTRALMSSVEPMKSMNDRNQTIAWELKHIPAIPEEENSPPDHELLPEVMLAPSNFQVDKKSGSMESWKSFGAFLYELNKDRQRMSPFMREQIIQMTLNCKSDGEKIDTLYGWLQDNMRYVSVQLGIGGWQSFDAAYVENNRYGDCKALSTFMKGMLEVVNIPAWQTIIHWDETDNYVVDDFPTTHFNHMMLYVPSEKMWLECTSHDLDPGEIDADEENKRVLFITPEGGVLATSPASAATDNQLHTIDTLRLGETTYVNGIEYYSGNRKRLTRELSHLSSKEQREYFMEQSAVTVQRLDRIIVHTDQNNKDGIIEYAGEFSQIGTNSGVRKFIPVNAVHVPDLPCSTKSKRVTDYLSKENFSETNDMFYSIPSGYNIEFLPAETTLEYKGMQYHVTVALENDFIHVHHQVTRMPFRLTPVEYEELCGFSTAVQKSNRRMIVLKKEL